MSTQKRVRSVGSGITSKRKGRKKQLDRERCKLRIYIRDHFERWTRVRNFMFNYGLAGFLLLTASTTAYIGGRLRKGFCYKIVDGPVKSDKYIWYQLTHRCWNENLWVADSYLSQSGASLCDNPVCSTRSKELACDILNNANITLRTDHPSRTVDSAYANKNIKDTCNGHAACRSMYTCRECSYPGAPVGDVCLDEKLLNFINELGKEKHIFVSSIAGACHSCGSRHYQGLAVDISRRPDDFNYYMQKCKNMSGTPNKKGTHVHCQF